MTAKPISLLPLIALAMAGAVAACETVEGAGQDIESAGRAVEDAAQDADD